MPASSPRPRFALETTLRSSITYEHAKLARENGFRVFMRFIALDTVEHHIQRVKRRAARGGHSASESTLRRVHASSLSNLRVALEPDRSGIEIIRIYDNTAAETRPRLILAARLGNVVSLADPFPQWLAEALGWSHRDLENHRRKLIGRGQR